MPLKHFLRVSPTNYRMRVRTQTRWLSHHSVVERVLEQYDLLKCFFADEVGTSRVLAQHTILQRPQNPLVRMYLAFLEFVLPIFSNLNRQMQSEAPQIHTPRKTISHAPRTILDCYMKSSYLASTPAEEIEFKNPLLLHATTPR